MERFKQVSRKDDWICRPVGASVRLLRSTPRGGGHEP